MFPLDRESAEKLAKMVESACVLLADYNGRLSAELEDRTVVCKLLKAYLSSQKKKVSDCDQRIEVWSPFSDCFFSSSSGVRNADCLLVRFLQKLINYPFSCGQKSAIFGVLSGRIK